jgi:hypothetical protein
MLKRSVLAVVISVAFACSTNAEASDGALTQYREPSGHRIEAIQIAQSLFDEVVSWICENFDLPSSQTRPLIEFASKNELTRIRIADRIDWHVLVQEETRTSSERNVVAVYDTISRTIYLPNDWIGKSAADQSILVHEMVHHLQNVAEIKFECPAAREKTAYLAQDRWLARFGLSLEKEFEVDMFTIVISSACM